LLDAPLGNSAEGGDGHRDLVGSHGERLPMKISTADDVAVAAAAANKDERIIRSAVQLHRRYFASLRQRIAHGAVDLRRAAQAVRILHPRVFICGTMRFANLTAFIEVRQIPGGHGGAGIRPCVHDARIECAGTSAERVQR